MKPICAGSEVKNRHEIGALGRRQPRRGFVEQHEARRAGQRQRDLELALLAIGEFADQAVLFVGQVHGLDQQFRCEHECIVGAGPEQRETVSRNTAAGQIDVVHHAQPGEERGYLVGAAQAPADALMGREDRYILAKKPDQARRGQKIPGDAVEQRGLARAIRAENGPPFARFHRKRHVRDCGQRAEHLGDAAQFQRIAGAGIASPGQVHPGRHDGRVHGPPPVVAALRAATPARQRSHRPSTPSGENSTIARKPIPMISLKRSAENPNKPRMSVENTCSNT